MGIFSGYAIEMLDEEIAAALLTPGREARRAVARGQLTIRRQLPDDARLIAVAADEFTAQVVIAATPRQIVFLRDNGRALLRTVELVDLSSVRVASSALGGFVVSFGDTGIMVRLRARATADRLRADLNAAITAARPRAVPVLYPAYFTDLLSEAGVTVTPVNVGRLVERTAFMIGCQAAAYFAHLGDQRAFDDFMRRFARGGTLERRPQVVDEIVDWLWKWNPECHADLRTRFDKWCDSLLRPGSFLAPGRPVPPFDESGAEGDNTAAWRAVFAKNRRDADHRGLTAS